MQTVLVTHHGGTLTALVCALFSSQPGPSGSHAGAGAAQVLVPAAAEKLQSPRAVIALVWGSEVGTLAAKPQQA